MTTHTKYKVTVYAETYTEILIEADTEEEAAIRVLSGDYQDGDVLDVTVKESCIHEVMTQQAPSDASAARLRRQLHDEYKTVRYMLTPLCNALEVSNTCDDPRTEENPENRAIDCGPYQLHASNTLTNSPRDIAPQDAIDLYLAEQGVYGLLLEAIAKIVEETWDVDIRTVEVNWGGMGSRSEDVRAAVFEAKYGLPWC